MILVDYLLFVFSLGKDDWLIDFNDMSTCLGLFYV